MDNQNEIPVTGAIIHVAGTPIGLVQNCARCGLVLKRFSRDDLDQQPFKKLVAQQAGVLVEYVSDGGDGAEGLRRGEVYCDVKVGADRP